MPLEEEMGISSGFGPRRWPVTAWLHRFHTSSSEMHKALLPATVGFENSSHVSLPFMVRVTEHLGNDSEEGNADA
jgi:hypothetical protein